ncbi:beta-lactamase family protein [Cellulophaga sp. E16_2]|uniref:serine hydrolase domain-containing protein n=1 Tax=Cellulophaga sp. E16_2 TaxID=2789297 RepID=UPI001A91D95B|nr:serine hydrolase domain-containing protein [Cellulophaga sp. E16_2]MBO0592980.1 beta-lactamase family protein [Cellulophaga sp. E16_2]
MENIKLKIFSILIICFIVSCSDDTNEGFEFGENFDRNKMDTFFSTIEEQNLGMGSVAIFKNGQLDYQKSFGQADIENSISATSQTKYRVASITKTFTASIIMQMIEENSLTLSTTLDTYFPELPNSNLITIEHLLRHRSGLFNYTDTAYGTDIVTQPATKQQLIDLFIENGTVFEPNEQTLYSNTNYVVLGFIIENIDQKSYSDAMRDRITIPLGLTNTYNGGAINTSNNEALSYNPESNEWILATETNITLVNGTGSIVSNPEDLNTFLQELFVGNVVSNNSLEQMKADQPNSFGMGLISLPFYEKTGFGGTGLLDGFQSIFLYFPDDNVSISITLNGVSTSMSRNDIIVGALSIYSDLEYALP